MRSIYEVVDRETAEVRRRLRIVSIRRPGAGFSYGRGCCGHDFLPHDLVEEGGTLHCLRCPWSETHASTGAE